MEKVWHHFCIVPPSRCSGSAVSAGGERERSRDLGSCEDLDCEHSWDGCRGMIACLCMCRACVCVSSSSCLASLSHQTDTSFHCHPRLEPRTEALASLGSVSLLWQSTESSSVPTVYPIHYTANITILFDSAPLTCGCMCEHLQFEHSLEPQSNLCFPFHRMPRMGGSECVCVCVF